MDNVHYIEHEDWQEGSKGVGIEGKEMPGMLMCSTTSKIVWPKTRISGVTRASVVVKSLGNSEQD
jgi:hypothetical protein